MEGHVGKGVRGSRWLPLGDLVGWAGKGGRRSRNAPATDHFTSGLSSNCAQWS